MPRPFTRGRVRPSNYPNISWRMLHTYYRNNWKLLKDNCYLAKKKDVTTANLQIGVNLKQRTLDILIPLQFFFLTIKSNLKKFTGYCLCLQYAGWTDFTFLVYSLSSQSALWSSLCKQYSEKKKKKMGGLRFPVPKSV